LVSSDFMVWNSNCRSSQPVWTASPACGYSLGLWIDEPSCRGPWPVRRHCLLDESPGPQRRILSKSGSKLPKLHDENLQRLQEWIRQPSIAAENRGVNEGCDLAMRLLRDAEFQQVTKIPTNGEPGIFATLDAGWQEGLELLQSRPTVNIEGLVAGYTGPGGKTILPRASRGVQARRHRSHHPAAQPGFVAGVRLHR
jgi:hypothetical protein